MRWAVERFPSHIIELMNFCTNSLPNTESGGTWRRSTNPLRGIFEALLLRGGLGPLGTVLRAPLLAVLYAGSVERAADDVIPHAGQVLHAAASHEHNGVLLEVVADARNVGGHLNTVCQPSARHLAQRRVWLLRCLG